jgi:hypothetical protein
VLYLIQVADLRALRRLVPLVPSSPARGAGNSVPGKGWGNSAEDWKLVPPCRIKIKSCRIKIQLIVAAEFPRPLAGDEGNSRTLSQVADLCTSCLKDRRCTDLRLAKGLGRLVPPSLSEGARIPHSLRARPGGYEPVGRTFSFEKVRRFPRPPPGGRELGQLNFYARTRPLRFAKGGTSFESSATWRRAHKSAT